jgi:hypothetical protein
MVRQVPVRYGSIPRKKGRSRWLGVPLERPLGARQDGEHFDVEGVVFGRCATLYLYGEMGRQSVPQMEAVLDELLSLHPPVADRGPLRGFRREPSGAGVDCPPRAGRGQFGGVGPGLCAAPSPWVAQTYWFTQGPPFT